MADPVHVELVGWQVDFRLPGDAWLKCKMVSVAVTRAVAEQRIKDEFPGCTVLDASPIIKDGRDG